MSDKRLETLAALELALNNHLNEIGALGDDGFMLGDWYLVAYLPNVIEESDKSSYVHVSSRPEGLPSHISRGLLNLALVDMNKN